MDKSKCIGLLEKFDGIMKDIGVPFWLTAGTLLGYHRDGDFIGHDMDIDVGVNIMDYKDAILDRLKSSGFDLITSYGTLPRGLEYSFTYNGIKIDIFFFYEEDGKTFHAVWPVRDGQRVMYKYEYTPFSLKEITFNGIRCLIPDNTELYIREQYGENWRVPDRYWNWEASPFNMRPTTITCKNNIHFKERLDNSVTVIIKSFERHQCLTNLLQSIRKFYPTIKIIVGDDSAKEYDRKNDFGIQYVRLPFNVGLAHGRNVLVSNVKTKYFVILDDDFVFTEETVIERFLYLIRKYDSDIDLCGGVITDVATGNKMQYYGNFHIQDRKIIQKKEIHGQNSDVKFCDLVLNFFIAKTDRIKEIGMWDPNFKLVEHSDFFLKSRDKGLKVAYTGSVNVLHDQYRDAHYSKFRCDVNGYLKMLLKKWDVDELITLDGATYKMENL